MNKQASEGVLRFLASAKEMVAAKDFQNLQNVTKDLAKSIKDNGGLSGMESKVVKRVVKELIEMRRKMNPGKNTNLKLSEEIEAGLLQPLSIRRDYGSSEEGSMMNQLERMQDADRIALAGDLSGMAKTAILSGGGDDPYSDDEKRQILDKIPRYHNDIDFEAEKAIKNMKNAGEQLDAMQEHLEDLVWIYGSSNDKRLRKAEIMLKALEKHRNTLEDLGKYIGRVARFVK